MNSIIRVTGAVGKVHCANPHDCLEELRNLFAEMPAEENDLIVLPKLALCSPSCGDFFHSGSLLEQCEQALMGLQELSAGWPCYILAGLAMEDCGVAVSVMAVLYRGELVGLLPTRDNPPELREGSLSDLLLPEDTLFACGSLRFRVLACGLEQFGLRAPQAVEGGCDLLVVPSYSPVRAGLTDEVCRSASLLSRSTGCAVMLVNGGVGDTSAPYVYRGFVAVYECGEELIQRRGGYESFACATDLDLDVIRASKRTPSGPPPFHGIPPLAAHSGLLRPVNPAPWLPKEGREDYLSELFALQVRSLVCRMENIGATRLVIGVSGGLDSTAALLVSAGAMDALGLPRENITGITMPGFGTTDRTYYNALSLLESLGASRRDISIRQAVQLHLEDIGHAGKSDVTYENAQARERAQILLDVANSISGIVVGTGDLSEAALGFCTFAGDQIANYNVNVCITKTVLRELTGHVAGSGLVEGVAEVVRDILDTPISPELLPPTDDGDIQQKTEEILGPYELHDFFLYYFLGYHMRPAKLYYYACNAFGQRLSPAFIKEKLRVFLQRFCASQFKRSCAPDAAAIAAPNLLGPGFYMPSDLDPSFLLREVEALP